jgi:hypothetical protein
MALFIVCILSIGTNRQCLKNAKGPETNLMRLENPIAELSI